MSSKKAVRRQRAERAKQQQVEQRSQARTFRIAIGLTVVAVVVLLAVAALRGGGGQTADGRVWSEEHGHWHAP